MSSVLKSEPVRRGMTVPGKREELFKRLIDAIQEDNREKQLSISFAKEFFLTMFTEQNMKTLEILKKHKENFISIITDKIPSINQRLNKLTLDINSNLTITNNIRSKTNDLMSLEISQNNWETENKKLKEELKNLKRNLKEKDDYLKMN